MQNYRQTQKSKRRNLINFGNRTYFILLCISKKLVKIFGPLELVAEINYILLHCLNSQPLQCNLAPTAQPIRKPYKMLKKRSKDTFYTVKMNRFLFLKPIGYKLHSDFEWGEVIEWKGDRSWDDHNDHFSFTPKPCNYKSTFAFS